ncbi:MAG: hypothetical protein J2P41_01875 [Blastocatellia bacterium]|nr:hypothetical protein [Blastocatellia bacterium]
MDDRLPLSALLSQALVAFTIEFDNEFEHSVPHRTTNHGSTGTSRSVPWLVSMAMWLHFLRYVPDRGISAKELYRLTGMSPKVFRAFLIRMSKWWGYVTVSESFVRPTPGGLNAFETWRTLTANIENRWRERFTGALIDKLRDALQSIVEKGARDYPDGLPILGYELLSEMPGSKPQAPDKIGAMPSSDYALPMLFSKLLLAFAVQFERESGLSLAVSANLLRIIDEGVRVAELPRLSGVSKEAIAMAVRCAEKSGLGIVQKSPGRREKVFVLNSEGRRAKEMYSQLVWNIEVEWKNNFGKQSVEKLRELLERLVGNSAEPSPLFKGLNPYPEGWRASVPRLEQLPHYPMVLHRGGFPDGS